MPTVYERMCANLFSGQMSGCLSYFEKHNYYIEAAYCYILCEKFDKARDLFIKYREENTRANWGLFLLECLENDISSQPSYFEIRNFLEIDLGLFLIYKRKDLFENVASFGKYMSYFNPETFKYLGRVLWAYDYIKEAIYFLTWAKDYTYNDPELHYLLAYIYFYNYNNLEKTTKAIDNCLNILPGYYPAVALRNKIANL